MLKWRRRLIQEYIAETFLFAIFSMRVWLLFRDQGRDSVVG
jgi:hypothetical protein